MCVKKHCNAYFAKSAYIYPAVLMAWFKQTLEIRGIEPLTYGLQSRRSSQLSYIPD